MSLPQEQRLEGALRVLVPEAPGPGHASPGLGISACADGLSQPHFGLCPQPSWRCMRTSSCTGAASTAIHP